MRHSLTDKDPVTLRSTCSVCGPVKMQRAGNGYACANRANATSRASKRRHPNRERRSKTEHRLTWKDPESRTGTCAVCPDPVGIVPYGRGWACPNGEEASKRVNHQDAPQAYCRDCLVADDVLVWLTDGACSRCADTDLNAMLARHADSRRTSSLLTKEELEAGFHLEGVVVDPEWMPDYESAVPGWKTLG